MPTERQIEIHECNNCGHITHKEEEVICWKCGNGEMIYQGKFYVETNLGVWEQFNKWWNQTAPEDFTLNLLGVIFWGAIIGVVFGMVFLFG